jgi:hypothetical protein
MMTRRRIRRIAPGFSSSSLLGPYQFGMRSASRRRRVSSRQRASSGVGLESSARTARARSRSDSARQVLQARRPGENSSARFRLPHSLQTFSASLSVLMARPSGGGRNGDCERGRGRPAKRRGQGLVQLFSRLRPQPSAYSRLAEGRASRRPHDPRPPRARTRERDAATSRVNLRRLGSRT